MKWIDIVSQAFSNLMRRKLRSALTMLGVVIGTAAIVVTVSLGYGAEETQMEAMESMANLRLIQVYPYGGYNSSTIGTTTKRITKITDQVVARIRQVANVEAVTPYVYPYLGDGYLMTGKQEAWPQLIAVEPREFAKFVKLKEGKYFTSNTSQMEFIMNETDMLSFVDPNRGEDPWGIDYYSILLEGSELPLAEKKIDWLHDKYTMQFRWEKETDSALVDEEPEIETKDVKARMVGYIKADINDMSYTGTFISIDWVKRFQRENKQWMKDRGIPALEKYDNVYVLADSVEHVTEIVKGLSEIGLQSSNALQWVEQMREQIRTMQTFLGFIGFIAMAVAALMIANTMMMSIYERTREIGVMKVLGCKLGNIRLMFLSEAAFIGIIGGIIGLLFSFGVSYALNNVEPLRKVIGSVMSSTNWSGNEGGKMSIIPTQLALSTWVMVTGVSVLSGVYPAQRAMTLSSLAAIRSAE